MNIMSRELYVAEGHPEGAPFRLAQRLPGPYGGVAGDGAEQPLLDGCDLVVGRVCAEAAIPPLRVLLHQPLEGARGGPTPERGGGPLHQHLARPRGGQVEAETPEDRLHLAQQGHLVGVEAQRLGKDERLHIRIATQTAQSLAQSFVVYALVRRVLIHDQEPLGRRADEEGIVQLEDGGWLGWQAVARSA